MSKDAYIVYSPLTLVCWSQLTEAMIVRVFHNLSRWWIFLLNIMKSEIIKFYVDLMTWVTLNLLSFSSYCIYQGFRAIHRCRINELCIQQKFSFSHFYHCTFEQNFLSKFNVHINTHPLTCLVWIKPNHANNNALLFQLIHAKESTPIDTI
jgi:hypothetical protein